MQPPTIREVIRRLEKEGYVLVNQTGSHRRYSDGEHNVTVAGNPSVHLLPKTWKRIQEQAGW